MPPSADMTIQDFHGNGWQISDKTAATTQATRSARRRMLGTTKAMKVSGMANDSDQDSGMFVPAITPTSVDICQATHKVMPLPRRW